MIYSSSLGIEADQDGVEAYEKLILDVSFDTSLLEQRRQ